MAKKMHFTRLLALSGKVKYMFIRREFSFTKSKCKLNIAYSTYPEGSKLNVTTKAPIFVLHGVFGSRSNWHTLAKRIAADTHRQVVTLDARNHGDSDHDPFMDYLTMCDDLLGVMDDLGVERSLLLGHSMGGKTVMTCALSKPERVEGLIVVDTAPKDSPGTAIIQQYAESMLKVTIPSDDIPPSEAKQLVGEQLQPFIKDIGIRQFLLTNLVLSSNGMYQWRCNLKAIFDNFGHLRSFPQLKKPCTDIKTVFIGGSKSQHIDSEALPAINCLFPYAEIHHIANAGHWVHSERPAQFVEIVRNFVVSLSKL